MENSLKTDAMDELCLQPGERIGHVSVEYKGLMLVWGGYKGYKDNLQTDYLPSDELWIYNAETEKWSRRVCIGETNEDDIPPGTSGAVGCVIKHDFYLYGGYQEDGNSDSLYRLDLTTMKWKLLETSGDHPLPCDKSVCWEHQDKLYLFGGYGPDMNIAQIRPRGFQFLVDENSHLSYQRGWNNQLVCYDPDKNEWCWPKCVGDVPMARAAHVAARVGDKVYIFGGRHGRRRMNDLFYIDCKSMTWIQVICHGQVPDGRSWHSLTTMSEEVILLYGGFSQDRKPFSDCWMFHLPSSTWTEIKLPFKKARLWHTAILSPFGEVLIFGGGTQNILNYTLRNIYAGDVITICLKPKSLYRLSLDVALNESCLRKQWSQLPINMQTLLHSKHESLMTNSAGS